MTDDREAGMGSDVDADVVDVASSDSFPASDAPAWATGRARQPNAGEASAQAKTRLPDPADPRALDPLMSTENEA